MYLEHKSFTSPENINTKIWRYMDVTKLLFLFEEQALFFPKITRLDDPLEGFLNKATVQKFRELPDGLSPETKAQKNQVIEENLRTIKGARTLLNVSSWHINDYESAAMWKLYLKSDEGIAIQSTYKSLRDSLDKTEKCPVYIGLVTYVDEDTDEMDWTNIFNYALCKRKSFEYERELRAVVLDRGGPEGILVPVDVEVLVGKIYVAPNSPDWINGLIGKIIKRYDMGISVEKSSMFESPLY